MVRIMPPGTRQRLLYCAALALLPALFSPCAFAQKESPAPQRSGAAPRQAPRPAEAEAGTQGKPGAGPAAVPERSRFSGQNARRREEWFYDQRAYPFKVIPAGARARALERFEQMRRAERERAAAGADARAIMASEMEWTPIGPQPSDSRAFGFTSGRIGALAVDPTNPDIVYTGGAQGGVWKSTDGGTTWTALTDFEASLAIGAIAIDPSSCTPGPCTTIYVGTGEQTFSSASYYGAGILKSTDAGATWTHLPGVITNVPGITSFQGPHSSGFAPGGGARIGALVVNPANPSVLLAGVHIFTTVDNGASSGIYRSTDGGVTWSMVLPGASGTDVHFDPNNPMVAWAALGAIFGDPDNGLYRSADMGVTWTRNTGFGFPTNDLGRMEIAIAPTNSNQLLVAIANGGNSSLSLLGIWRSTNGGGSWSMMSPPDFCTPQCWYDFVIAFHPANADVAYAGGSAANFGTGGYFIRSTTGGLFWEPVAGTTNATRIHVDVHALAFGAGPGLVRLYNGNDGGVYSADVTNATGPVVWENRNAGLNLTQFYPGLSIHPATEDRGLGGTQDNGTQRYSGGLLWEEITCGDGGWTAIDPFMPSTVYATCQFIDVRKSFFNGDRNTFFIADAGLFESGDDVAFIPPFIVDPNVPGRLYFGTYRVWQSMDGGVTWQPVSPDLDPAPPFGVLRSVAVAPSDSSYVFTGGSTGRIWRTTNAGDGAGAIWQNLTDTSVLPNRRVSMVAGHPFTPEILYAVFSGFRSCPAYLTQPACDGKGHVFRWQAGVWTDITGAGMGRLPDTPVNDIVIDPNDLTGNTLYVATDVGVFFTTDGGITWTTLSQGLPRVAVTSLKLRQASRILRAGTHGRGMWDLQLPGLPAFHLRSISPSTVTGGASGVTLEARGGGFTAASRIRWNGEELVTMFVDATQLTAAVDDARVAAGALVSISVADPVAGASNELLLTVTSIAPVLDSINPTSAAQGSGDLTLTASGTFAPGTVLRFNDVEVATTFLSASLLEAVIPESLLAVGGIFPVRAFTGPPGGGLSASRLFTVTAPPPPNDNFADAIVFTLTGGMFTDTQNNVGATTEGSDPNPPCASGSRHRSIWYRFAPTQTVALRADTLGSAYDTVLSVWTGPALGSLTNVACNDDAAALGGPSSVSFTANAGITYHFMITGWSVNDAGLTRFNVEALLPPPNDNFANALPVGAIPFVHETNVTLATVESTDPAPCGGSPINGGRSLSVWYRYAPGAAGAVQANTLDSNYDTILSVWTGSPGQFSLVACNDDAVFVGGPSAVSFNAAAGALYFFMVSSWDGVGGDLVFRVTAGPPPGPDFGISASPSSATVNRGQSANTTVTLTPFSGFSGMVSLTCSGLPAQSNCSFSPASVNVSGAPASSTLTISTTAPSLLPPAPPSPPPQFPVPWPVGSVAALLLAALLAGVWTRLPRRTRWAGGAALAGVALLLILQTACGGGGGGGGGVPTPPPVTNPGTPPGTYTVTITGTSGNTVRSIPFTLTVN